MFFCDFCKIFEKILSEAVVWRCFVKRDWPANLLKMKLWLRCFPVKFAKFFRTPFFIEHFRWLLLSFDRIPSNDCFLCLAVNFEKLFKTPLLQNTSRELLISCTNCRISTTRYSKKLFHRCFFYSQFEGESGIHKLENRV